MYTTGALCSIFQVSQGTRLETNFNWGQIFEHISLQRSDAFWTILVRGFGVRTGKNPDQWHDSLDAAFCHATSLRRFLYCRLHIHQSRTDLDRILGTGTLFCVRLVGAAIIYAIR